MRTTNRSRYSESVFADKKFLTSSIFGRRMHIIAHVSVAKIDIRLRYTSLFVYQMHWSLYFLNEH